MDSPGFVPSDSFLHEHVFEGIWEKYDESAYSRQIWTLKSNKVFFIMAALAIIIQVAGSRSWVIGRYVILCLAGKPVRLTDEAHSEPLLNLSQGRVVWRLLLLAKIACARPWKKNEPSYLPSTTASAPDVSPPNDPGQSAWFGIFALLNFAIFVVISVAIPIRLTDGALGAPIVKSKPTEECFASDPVGGWLRYTINLPTTDAIFHECFDKVDKACGSQYYFTSPIIEKRRLDTCPFPRDVCQNQSKPFEISHMNISAYAVGVNSPSKLTLNHRLTCVPVVVEKFQLFPGYSPNYSLVSARTMRGRPPGRLMDFSVRLSTVNGPNLLSNESSGLRVAEQGGPTAVKALPKHIIPLSLSIPQYQELIHESIRREDGQSFLIVHQAGRTLYREPIDDPFFTAHNADGDYFLPDYEATALGCVEQYQFCIPTLSGSISCTSWGYMNECFDQIRMLPYSGQIDWNQAYSAFSEQTALFSQVSDALSVYKYIALRNVLHNMSPLLRGQTSNFRSLEPVDDPWALEVETWFIKAIVNAIFRVRMGAEYHLSNITQFRSVPGLGEAFVQQWAICGRVLFRDADYTNIDWIGFWITTAVLLVICLASYLIKQLHNCGIIVFNILTHPGECLHKICSISQRLIEYLFYEPWWKVPISAIHFHQLWRTRPFANIPRAPPLWYGQRHGETTGSANELDGTNHVNSRSSRHSLDDYDLDDLQRYTAIDNPPP